MHGQELVMDLFADTEQNQEQYGVREATEQQAGLQMRNVSATGKEQSQQHQNLALTENLIVVLTLGKILIYVA
jgi:hypothetical protein